MPKPTPPLQLSRDAANLLSAALRHVRDAERLRQEPGASSDGAYHIAAFGPECARKACLSTRWLDKLVGHGAEVATEDLLLFAVSIDPLALRYEPLNYPTRYPALHAWKVESRYARTGTCSPSDAERICLEAREAVDAVVVALWADGRLPDGVTPW